jgi:transposase
MDKRMSEKEAKRGQVLALLEARRMSQREAAKQMGVTPRQVRRLLRAYRADGLAGLVSQRRGRRSNRRLSEAVHTAVLALIGEHYRDFGPTLANEKLRERHGVYLSVESTRQLMIQAGYWQPRRGAKARVHPRRERRACVGELIQIDGSPHDWFEGRSAPCTLLVFIDDASGRLMQLRLVEAETTLDYMQVLQDYIQQHGLPVALYSDKHSIFRINAKDADPNAQTQFSRAAQELGIECIHAHSPQAKGRVERANQTLQDRLVKDMRLAGINDRATANAWLPQFIADYNQRFAVTPHDPRDVHQPYTGSPQDLTRILSKQTTKTLSNNLSCQHKGILLQVASAGTGLGLRGAKVTLHEHVDGSKALYWRHKPLAFSEHAKPVKQNPPTTEKTLNARVDQAVTRRRTGHKPSPHHPWRNYPSGTSAPDGIASTA